ncbi:zinc finger protein [Staphylococcus aureus]|uniref:Zinc finger protein n=1 Tax=Staphylococcus aureus TaxID=1280 RepID=A0A2X2K7L2_STAAU|nr:zinc finger protein [Staphylococcus aureus]
MPKVYGSLIDTETRCRIILPKKILLQLNLNVVINTIHAISAIMSLKKHAIKRWSEPSFNEKAILCGVCKHELTINEYMMVERCPNCQSRFNNRCKYHYHIYFEI